MPPPPTELGLEPLLIVRLEMLTVMPEEILNTRLALFPLTVRLARVGPLMAMLLPITSAPLVSVIVPATEKLIVSPLTEAPMASRKEPAPLSLRVLTVRVAAVPRAGRSSSARRGQAKRHRTASASSV